MNPRRFTSPGKSSSVAQQGGGIYVGRVSSVNGNKVFVEIPSVVPGFSFGPCLRVPTPKETAISLSGEPQSVSVVHEIAVGDKVACAFLNNQLDEVLILGKLV